MAPFPFPKSSTPGARAGEGEGRYMNCYPVVEGGRSYVRRAPGLSKFAATNQTGIRGMLDVDDGLYVVYNTAVVRVVGSLVTVFTGSVPGTDPVTIARNNKAGAIDVVIVRQSGGAYVLGGGAVSSYPDADLPTNVNSVAFLGGYFLFTVPDGRFVASDLNTTDINALSFATAEARADGLRRVIVQGNLAFAMGQSTIEIYQNVGTEPFPLQRQSTVIPVGIRATTLAVGDEEAWSSALYFVASDNTVRALSGFETRVVSTADVERFIAASDPDTTDMAAFVWQGKPYVSLSSALGTWVLNVSSGDWHERISTSATRWRGKRSAYSAGRWVIGDALSGDLFDLSSTYLENGQTLGGFIQSGQLKEFPSRVATRLFADFTEAEMSIYVSWSMDGGKTFGTELTRSISNAERYPVAVSNLGLSTHHGIIVKFRWEGAADFSFSGATADRVDVRQP